MRMQRFVIKISVLACLSIAAIGAIANVHAAEDAPRFIPGTPILAPKTGPKDEAQKKSRITVSTPTAPSVSTVPGVQRAEPVQSLLPTGKVQPSPVAGSSVLGIPKGVPVDEKGMPKLAESFEEVEQGIQSTFNPPADPATLAEIKKVWEKGREEQRLQQAPPVEPPFVSLLGHKTMSEKLAVVVPSDMFEGAQSKNNTEDGITEIVYPGKGEKKEDWRNSFTVQGYRDGMKAGLSSKTVLKELKDKYVINCYTPPVVKNYGPMTQKNFAGSEIFSIGCPATRNGDKQSGLNPGDGQGVLVMNIPGKQDMFVVRWNKRIPKGAATGQDLFTDQDIQRFLAGMHGVSVQQKALLPQSAPGFSLNSATPSVPQAAPTTGGAYITPPPAVR